MKTPDLIPSFHTLAVLLSLMCSSLTGPDHRDLVHMFVEASQMPVRVRLSYRQHLLLEVHMLSTLLPLLMAMVAPPSWVPGEHVF